MLGRRLKNTLLRAADEELISAVCERDQQAFEALFDRHGKVAWSLAFRLLGDRGAAEDLVQDAFLTMWTTAARYNSSQGSVRTWLLSIVHHRAVERLRQMDAGRRRQDALEQELAVSSDAPDTAEVAAGNLEAGEVRTVLAAVPDDQRQVLQLAYYGGYSQTEIADMLSLPVGTVKSRMRLGLERVRRELDPGMAAR